jgi:hypothetical protein
MEVLPRTDLLTATPANAKPLFRKKSRRVVIVESIKTDVRKDNKVLANRPERSKHRNQIRTKILYFSPINVQLKHL